MASTTGGAVARSPSLGLSPMQISSIPLSSFQHSASENEAAGAAPDDSALPFRERLNTSLECVVCQEAFKQGENIRRLPCLHQFHAACVDPWLARHARCPLCNTDISLSLQSPLGGNQTARRRLPSHDEFELEGPAFRRERAPRRPPRQRIGRRKGRMAKREKDLVSGAWLNQIMSASGLGDELAQAIDAKNYEAAPAIFDINALGDSFVDAPRTHKVRRRSEATPSSAKATNYKHESREECFVRHWKRLQRKIRDAMTRESKRSHFDKGGDILSLWDFVVDFEDYVVGLMEQRRRGPVTVLPSLQPLIDGADVEPWPGLSSSLNLPPELEGAGLYGDEEQSDIAEIGGGESKVGDHQGRKRKMKKRKKRAQSLSFSFKFPSHRLLAHGVCQFHGLTSKSHNAKQNGTGEHHHRIFRITRLKKASRRDNPSKVTLANDLAILLFRRGTGPALNEEWDSSTALSAALIHRKSYSEPGVDDAAETKEDGSAALQFHMTLADNG